MLETEVGRSGLPAVGSGSRETRQGGRIWRTQCCSKCCAPGRSIFLPAARARGEKDADKGEEKPKKHVGQKPKKPAAGSARVCLAKLEASQLAVRGAQGRALRSGGRIRHRWRESRSASGARRSHVPISGCCGAFRRRSADPPGPPSVARRARRWCRSDLQLTIVLATSQAAADGRHLHSQWSEACAHAKWPQPECGP